MDETGKVVVEYYKDVIAEHIIPSQVLPHLVTFLSDQDCDRICQKEESSVSEACYLLITLLTNCKQNGWYSQFLQAIRNADFTLVADLLQGHGNVQNQKILKNLLKVFYPSLYKDIIPQDIMPHLVQMGCLNDEDQDYIYAKLKHKGRGAAATALLSRVVKRKITWFPAFMHALKENNHEHIAEQIDPEEVYAGAQNVASKIANALESDSRKRNTYVDQHGRKIRRSSLPSMSDDADCSQPVEDGEFYSYAYEEWPRMSANATAQQQLQSNQAAGTKQHALQKAHTFSSSKGCPMCMDGFMTWKEMKDGEIACKDCRIYHNKPLPPKSNHLQVGKKLSKERMKTPETSPIPTRKKAANKHDKGVFSNTSSLPDDIPPYKAPSHPPKVQVADKLAQSYKQLHIGERLINTETQTTGTVNQAQQMSPKSPTNLTLPDRAPKKARNERKVPVPQPRRTQSMSQQSEDTSREPMVQKHLPSTNSLDSYFRDQGAAVEEELYDDTLVELPDKSKSTLPKARPRSEWSNKFKLRVKEKDSKMEISENPRVKVSFELPDGACLTQTFQATDCLTKAKDYVKRVLQWDEVQLLSKHTGTAFEDREMSSTLEDLEINNNHIFSISEIKKC